MYLKNLKNSNSYTEERNISEEKIAILVYFIFIFYEGRSKINVSSGSKMFLIPHQKRIIILIGREINSKKKCRKFVTQKLPI